MWIWAVIAAVCRQESVRPQIQAVNADAGTGSYAINPGLRFPFSLASSPSSTSSSVPATFSAWRSLRSVSSWAYSSENILVLSCESGIECSGLFSAVIGPHRGTRGLSSNRKRLSPGIWLGEEVSRLMRNPTAGTDHCLTLRRTSEPVSVPRGILDFSPMQHPGDPLISRARRPDDGLFATHSGISWISLHVAPANTAVIRPDRANNWR